MKPTRIKRVLTIAGSDSGGGAGIQADLKTIAALGAYGMSVVTAVTAQNTQGVQDILVLPPAFVGRQFDAVADDIGIDALKTRMLAHPEIVKIVAAKLRALHITKTVFDAVLEAKGGV
jgi:hydroxymethylpyrimidine kinase/phosphomethylpyrimidine kinase